jgi:type II secretory pathway pseudopilin PulG
LTTSESPGAVSWPETGETLIEVIVAMVIMAIAIVVLLGGMTTSLTSSSEHRIQANAEVVLVGAVEALKDQTRNPYVSCATASSYSATSGVALPTGWPASTVTYSIAYWNGSNAFVSSCSSDNKVQQLTVTVKDPSSKVLESLTTYKRNPS